MQVVNIPVDAENRETTRQGSAGFPIAVYHSVMSRNVLGYTRLHWHAELQFCLVTHGVIRFYVDEKQYLLEAGDGIFINSGFLHMARPVNHPDSAYICVDTAPRLLGGFPGSVMEQRYLQPLLADTAYEALTLRQDTPWQQEILASIERVFRLHEERPPCYELEIQSELYRMFAALLRRRPPMSAQQRRSHANSAGQKIVRYLTEHYAEKITLSDIADYASYTQSECCRIFKRFTGETIFSYLRSYRLERSAMLLKDTSQSVSEIAYACGFRSASYYIEAFHAQFGITPLQFRNEIAGRP